MTQEILNPKKAASEIKNMLKQEFPAAKFDVSRTLKSVFVEWVDGPSTDEVEFFTNDYSLANNSKLPDKMNPMNVFPQASSVWLCRPLVGDAR